MISPELIRRYPFFAGLSHDQITTLAQLADEKSVETGHCFFREGDELKYFYMTLEGRVAINLGLTDHGAKQQFFNLITGKPKLKDVPVNTIESGDFFGWSGLIPPYQATASAIAMMPSRVISFSCEELLRAFQEDCQFGYLMTQKVAKIVRQRVQDLQIELLAGIDGQPNLINRLKLLRQGLPGSQEMKTVHQILETKGYEVWSIAPDASVFDAINLMADKSVGALLVLDDGDLVGIISERDYARKVILRGRSSKDTPVSEIMIRNVITTTPEKTAEHCLALMTAKRIRHLPVLVDDQLVGIVSIGDLVRTVITDQKILIEQLENYILETSSVT